MESPIRNVDVSPEECDTIVRMDAVTRKVLSAMEEMPNIYEQFPGLVGLGMIAEHNSPPFLTACSRFSNAFYPDIPLLDKRLKDAKIYLGKTAPGLSRGGRTNGYLINALIAASRPQDFKPEQTKIWGDKGKYIPLLLSVEGIVKFLIISAQVHLSVPCSTNVNTCAYHMFTLSQESGSPHANGFCALLAAAMEGSLTPENCMQTFKALCVEAADPSTASPASINALSRMARVAVGQTGIPLDCFTKFNAQNQQTS